MCYRTSETCNFSQILALTRERRRRCRLHILQLLLAMVVSSDRAISTLQSTSGFKDAVVACSSYARLKEEKPDRPPIANILSFLFPFSADKRNHKEPRTIIMRESEKDKQKRTRKEESDELKGGDVSELASTANKLLAAIGHNIWVPKAEGQKGLRILCLDGGGTRGMTSLGSLQCIVNTLGIEPCDAFDMIVGTSTGGIIAFLIGLRLESSEIAKKRYDECIKRIFVKSALATPMLVITTAMYDEGKISSFLN